MIAFILVINYNSDIWLIIKHPCVTEFFTEGTLSEIDNANFK